MKIRIEYETHYRYETRVSFSPHLFRIFPKPDRFITVEQTHFETNPGAEVQYRRDLFDNEVASCFYPEPADELRARLWVELTLRERNAFHFLLESHALEFPFHYTPEESRILAPYLVGTPVTLPFWQPRREATVKALIELNHAIFQHINYERREHGPARAPEETLQFGKGACRDLSLLLATALRTQGVAARLASGFLCELDTAPKRAEGALHAWVEAYLPGAGWVGIDPTNGVFCTHRHITTAVGLGARDISPIEGRYYGDEHVPSSMQTSLQITPASQGL